MNGTPPTARPFHLKLGSIVGSSSSGIEQRFRFDLNFVAPRPLARTLHPLSHFRTFPSALFMWPRLFAAQERVGPHSHGRCQALPGTCALEPDSGCCIPAASESRLSPTSESINAQNSG